MSINILTVEDFQAFRAELLREIRSLLSQKTNQSDRQWLRSNEVCRLLTIAPGTLRNLRRRGELTPIKLRGVLLYHSDDIKRTLDERRKNHVRK